MKIKQTYVTTVACILVIQTVHASWWYLGLSGSTFNPIMTSPTMHYRNKCSRISVLDKYQRQLCTKSRHILEVLRGGASLSIEECQHQFQTRRWNCTTFNETSVFGKLLDINSREKAFIYAVSAAGIMYSVTRACAKGQLHICGCDQKIRRSEPKGQFIWGGCSHNVRYGNKFTKQFTDLREDQKDAAGLMNLWNNDAGRKTIRQGMKLLCKCHGVSGSCSVRICWKTMGSFRKIGSQLSEKFDGAAKVKLAKKRKKIKLLAYSKQQKKPSKNDLVYLEDSPNFCVINNQKGILGTTGRECNKTSYGLDGCLLMCCGRGYKTIVTETSEDCDCKFFWCCRVECKKCKKIVNRHYCN